MSILVEIKPFDVAHQSAIENNRTCGSNKAESVPGIIGRPASKADWRADTLSPILAITEE